MSRRLGLVLALAALLLGACQSANENAIEAEGLSQQTLDDPVIPVGPGGSIDIETGDLFFVHEGRSTQSDAITIEVAQGEIDVAVTNIGAAPHNFRVDEAVSDAKKVEANGGEEQAGTLALFPGTYTFYCDISGHRAAGMEGTLIVTPGA